jgi:hypothetical protein
MSKALAEKSAGAFSFLEEDSHAEPQSRGVLFSQMALAPFGSIGRASPGQKVGHNLTFQQRRRTPRLCVNHF